MNKMKNKSNLTNLRIVSGSNASIENTSNDSYIVTDEEIDGTDDMNREVFDAKLAQNKAEAEVIASEMRRELAEFRAFQSQQLASMNSSLSDIKGEISSIRGELVGAKGEAAGQKEGLSGQIEGIKSSISTMQWMTGTVLAMIGIGVALLAIPGIDKILH